MKSSYNGKPVPTDGKPLEYSGGTMRVPDRPILPYIEGDGTGRDIWKASRACLRRCGRRRLRWQTKNRLV